MALGCETGAHIGSSDTKKSSMTFNLNLIKTYITRLSHVLCLTQDKKGSVPALNKPVHGHAIVVAVILLMMANTCSSAAW
jgi:hypothetical protein